MHMYVSVYVVSISASIICIELVYMCARCSYNVGIAVYLQRTKGGEGLVAERWHVVRFSVRGSHACTDIFGQSSPIYIYLEN